MVHALVLLVALCLFYRSQSFVSTPRFSSFGLKPRFASLQPVRDNVLVRMAEAESVTAGGIILPDSAQNNVNEGSVVAVGEGSFDPDSGAQQKISVAPGDGVVFNTMDGTKLKINNTAHHIVKDNDVLLKFNGTKPTIDSVVCLRDNVLIKLIEEEVSSSGLVTSTAKSQDTGLVVKVGPGREAANGKLIPMSVKEGDHVKFREYGKTEIKIDRVIYYVLTSYDIIAKW